MCIQISLPFAEVPFILRKALIAEIYLHTDLLPVEEREREVLGTLIMRKRERESKVF